MRIQKYLSQQGMASRREAEELLRRGRILVNGVTVTTLGTSVNPAKDRVEISGGRKKIAVLLNKPAGFVTTRSEKEGPTVYSLLKDEAIGLAYVGRLDKETSGLLLFTDDGVLAARLTDPRYGAEKEYAVRVRERITPEALRRMREGIRLREGTTKPARVTKHDAHSFHIVLTEGMHHQVRRMCEAVRLTVLSLERVRINLLTIRGLKPGEWRKLTAAEIAALKSK